jgi:hypothetical protein
MLDLIRREPVLVKELVEKGIALSVAFGLGLRGDQVAALMAVVGALLSVLARSQVTPVAKLEDENNA